jgi:hypothetical protein
VGLIFAIFADLRPLTSDLFFISAICRGSVKMRPYRRWRVAIPHTSAHPAPARPIFPPTFPNYFSKFRFPETKILKIKVLYGVFCDF